VLADPADPTEPEAPGALRLPVAQAERPLTLPHLILNPTVGFDVTRIQANDTYANLTAGVELGILDDLSLHALFLPLQIAGPGVDGFHYGQTSEYRGPSVGATFRFVRGVVELGLGFDVRLITAEGLSGVALIPALPLRVHIGKSARLDFVPQLNVTRATQSASADEIVTSGGGIVNGTSTNASGNSTMASSIGGVSTGTSASAVRLDVPVTFLYNIVETVHVGIKSGLTIYDLSDAQQSTGIPIGLFAGYAVPGKNGPLLDIDPFFTFPYLIMPGRSTVTNPGEYVVGVNIGGFIYL
jgi:hypothetical protein